MAASIIISVMVVEDSHPQVPGVHCHADTKKVEIPGTTLLQLAHEGPRALEEACKSVQPMIREAAKILSRKLDGQ